MFMLALCAFLGLIVKFPKSNLEFELSLCEAVNEARRHADVNGLSDALQQIALETDTTQFSR